MTNKHKHLIFLGAESNNFAQENYQQGEDSQEKVHYI